MQSPEERPRRILLCDCDAFFVQVARLLDPAGVGRIALLLVGGRPDQRGVVTSASYEARAYGCRSGMPTSRALRLCPDATVVPVPRAECSARSRRVRAALERFAPVVDPASIDEFYLDLTGTELLYRGESLEATCHRIRRAVLQDTEISISIGAATNRLVAKLAVRLAKPAGVHVVPPGEEAAFMRGLDLRAIPGVGPRFGERLERFGLLTVAEALAHDRATLAAWLGDREGAWLFRRIRGQDDAPVTAPERARSVSHEQTFPEDVDDDAVLRREILALAAETARRLRSEGFVARTVTVKVKDADFRIRQASRTLSQAVEADRPIRDVALELLGRVRHARRVPVRLLGVALSQLESEPEAPAQLGLFEAGEPADATSPADTTLPAIETERDRRVSRAVDEVRGRFGRDAIAEGRTPGE